MKYSTSNCLGLLVWGSHADTTGGMSVLDWLEQWPKSPWLQAQVPPDSLLSYTYVYKCETAVSYSTLLCMHMHRTQLCGSVYSPLPWHTLRLLEWAVWRHHPRSGVQTEALQGWGGRRNGWSQWAGKGHKNTGHTCTHTSSFWLMPRWKPDSRGSLRD